MASKFCINLDNVPEFDISLSQNDFSINNLNNPNYKPLNLYNLSYYYPTLDIFNSDSINTSQCYSLNTDKQIINFNTVLNKTNNTTETKNIFFKFAPLLDPTRYMIGKYNDFSSIIQNLPQNNESNTLQKYKSFYNASYTDNFACLLISKLLHSHNFLHGIEYYGSFLAIQKKYRIDVVDELEYLFESEFFRNNLNKLFTLDDFQQMDFLNYGSRSNKPKLNISNSKHNLTISSINSIDLNIDDLNPIEEEIIYEKNIKLSSNETISSYENDNNDDDDDDDNSIENVSDDDDDDDNDNSIENDSDECYSESESENSDDNSNSTDEKPVFSYINDFPVHTICIEKCDGTFDKLLSSDMIDIDNARSILFQIIMILITYQKCFNLTHNDLHTNNIMYINTDIKFLYYKFNKKIYKVPTYGKIIKIIDYGRSIFKFNGNLFCSDSYSPGGDAHTQYNTEPFLDENKARLDPNYSFDLCRLGCSIYDFVIDYDDKYSDLDDFQKIIYDWCSDDNGKNILYKKNGNERYPNFKLYKMIARTVHNHCPQDQLNRPFFKSYLVKTKNINESSIFNIDKLPVYI